MTYVEGFVIAVPKANKENFIRHGNEGNQVFIEFGAIRAVECWQADVPPGQQTDFFRAVECREDEAVVFSWIEWPDQETRDRAMPALEEAMKTDPRMDPEKKPMPFDAKRMIYGGFSPVVDLRAGA